MWIKVNSKWPVGLIIRLYCMIYMACLQWSHKMQINQNAAKWESEQPGRKNKFSSWASSSLSSSAIFSLIFVQLMYVSGSKVRSGWWTFFGLWKTVFDFIWDDNQLLNLNFEWLTKTLFKSINTFTLPEGTFPLNISKMTSDSLKKSLFKNFHGRVHNVSPIKIWYMPMIRLIQYLLQTLYFSIENPKI